MEQATGLHWLQRATLAGQAADAARAADQVPVGYLTLEIGCQLKGFQAGKKVIGAHVQQLQGYLHLADSCRVRGVLCLLSSDLVSDATHQILSDSIQTAFRQPK